MVNWTNSTQCRWLFMFAAMIAAAFVCGTVSADTYVPTRVWDNGGADGDWSLAGGWNPSGTPISSDYLAINNGATVSFSSTGVVVERLYLASDEFLEGHMIVTGGDLTITTLFRPGDENLGTFTQTGGSVTAANAFRMGERGPEFENSNGHGTYSLSNGTLTLNGSSSNTRIGSTGATGIFNQTGGTVMQVRDPSTGGMQISTTVSGAIGHGFYNISGSSSVLSVLGTVLVDATANDGQGDGHFNITGAGPTINFGAYTQNEGGYLSYTSDANGVAPMHVTNNVDLDGELAIDLSALTANPSTILLIDNQSANAIIGAFSNAAEGAVFGNYTLTYLYDNGGGVGNDLALLLSQHPGDANGDGMVNLADLQILGDNWQSTTATWAQADFTGDGNVNLADLQILGDNWGFGVGPDVSFDEALAGVVIPEPATLGLLGLGGMWLLRRRGNRC